ncbi:DUF4438 domain-containing protein [Anoxybacter fermentans]|uniref:DUF4438 domain-containing protein n=1 Tax=Anoxybacter fermentans TaxID=1323375 RepID=A0A3Q9HSP7_9FIRM|nr:DUF4438 domain-containing protein [Anoxybacter fermentans]
MLSVKGKVSHPVKGNGYTVTHEGEPVLLPGVGGITYNVKVGDNCMKWVGDHVEPGVSIKLDEEKDNNALNILACIGNKAIVRTGDAKGAEGFVTGKHGGIEHVLIYFDDETLEKLNIGDEILIKSIGQGLAIEEMPEVKVMNLDPELLEKMNLKFDGELLEVPVVAEIPAELMGSGLGAYTAARGDYDLTTADPEVLCQYGLENLRFGDLVALLDTDNSYGRCFKKGAVSIGVVVHSNCVIAGHGPGITTIFTSAKGKIRPVRFEKANIAYYMGVRDF